MKILITGTHSTGKSTLLSALQSESKFKDFLFIGGVTREAKQLGLSINQEGDISTQIFCASTDVLNILKNKDKDVVYDRSIVDTFIYSKYLWGEGKLPYHIYQSIFTYYYYYKDSFDYIFWLRPEFDLVDDGVRDTDLSFQSEIDKLFELEFKSINHSILSGDTESRVKQLIDIINGK